MKKILAIFLAVILIAISVFVFLVGAYLPEYLTSDHKVILNSDESDTLTIMSTNVRCLSYDDFLEKSWFYRAKLIVEDINSVKPDIIGFQEATFVHYDFLKEVMDGYDSEMAYRDDFVLSEGCPIFWRTDKFEKVDSGSFWLSETPEVMSKDWGSAHYRICIYVILRDIKTGKEFAIFNTHLDHVSEQARINGIQVVLDKIQEFGDIPSYLMGDMNATDDSETISFTKNSFDDAKVISPITEDTRTFHRWGDPTEQDRIDYILISKDDAEVYEYHVLDNCYGGVYSSDHSSIYIKTSIK